VVRVVKIEQLGWSRNWLIVCGPFRKLRTYLVCNCSDAAEAEAKFLVEARAAGTIVERYDGTIANAGQHPAG
jgi:hypothetical protein